MKPSARRALAGAALASALLTGCDVGELLDPQDTGAEPPLSEPSDEGALDAALPIGETFEGVASTTVESVLRGKGADSWLPAGANFEWLSASVQTCVSAGGARTEVGWYQWAAIGADGGWYAADLDYDRDRPAEQYPRLVDLAPGDCAEGRILIPVPRDAELVTLTNASPSGVAQGSWLIGDIGVPAATDDE